MSGAATIKPAISAVTMSHLQQAFKLALSMVLLYWLGLWMNWDMPKYGALAIVLISLDTTGASLQKGVMRIVGTTAGLAIGMLGLALFAQDGWMTLGYHASYLIVVGYFMQTSRYPYAWYVAGFLPSLLWATTYGKVDNVFHYVVFRYLETTAGIVIYTMISTTLWPRQAGPKLARQGAAFCTGLRELLGYYRQQLADGDAPAEATELRNRLAGNLRQIPATLQAAYVDTPSVAANRRAWESFRVSTRAISDAMELWRESINDCRHLDLDRLLPELSPALERLDQRLKRIDDLWQVQSAGKEAKVTSDEDNRLLDPQPLECARQRRANLSHLDRGALLSFIQQLNDLDTTTRELLRTMRVLAGVAPVGDLESNSLPLDFYRPSSWDPVRLINGLLPAVCLTVAYFFWIYFDPPTGPSVPNMAATLALSIVLTPMDARKLILVLLGAIWLLVAPVYFLVMPRLDSGFQLLALIFGYSFVFSLVGARSPGIKTMALAMFVMMTGISNQQSYSFIGLVDGAMMLLLALGIIAVVQALLSPSRPEQILLSSVRRFFDGCARVTGEFALSDSGADPTRGRRLRKRYFESMILPAPGKIQAAQKHLDYKLYPDNSPEKVQRFLDSLQSIMHRMQSLEIARDRIVLGAPELTDSFISLGRQVQESMQRVFEHWASNEPGDEFQQHRDSLSHLSREVEQQFEAVETSEDPISDQTLSDLYTMLGSVRGLIEAMDSTQGSIRQINWQAWATTRF